MYNYFCITIKDTVNEKEIRSAFSSFLNIPCSQIISENEFWFRALSGDDAGFIGLTVLDSDLKSHGIINEHIRVQIWGVTSMAFAGNMQIDFCDYCASRWKSEVWRQLYIFEFGFKADIPDQEITGPLAAFFDIPTENVIPSMDFITDEKIYTSAVSKIGIDILHIPGDEYALLITGYTFLPLCNVNLAEFLREMAISNNTDAAAGDYRYNFYNEGFLVFRPDGSIHEAEEAVGNNGFDLLSAVPPKALKLFLDEPEAALLRSIKSGRLLKKDPSTIDRINMYIRNGALTKASIRKIKRIIKLIE